MHKIKLFLLFSLFLSNPLFAGENDNIIISDAWISEAPPNVSVLAAYAKIENLTDKDKTLVSISSPFFLSIELHLSKVVDEIAKMEKQESLKIPAKSYVVFTPGAYHLMLFNPESVLKAGDTAPITFSFADGSTNTIAAMVKKRMTGEHQHDHEHHHDH